MKKRLLYCIAFTSSAILIAGKLLAQTPVYVDASRPDNSGDGLSWATAKKTIGAGISAVAAGGTVNVAAGTYNDSIWINNKSLTLKGAGKTQTHIVGLGDAGPKVTVRIQNSSGVTIDGIHVKNPTQTHPSSSGGFGAGIRIFTTGSGVSNNVLIQNCLVDSIGDPNRTSTNASFGILVEGTAQNIEVANNEVRDIKAAFTTGYLVGILVRGFSSNVSVHDNVVSDIVGTGGSIVQGVGIQAATQNNVTVSRNAIDRAHRGIFTAGPGSPDITDNMITNSDSCGMLLRANSQTVTGNTVSGSLIGIGLWPVGPPLNATITDNKITGNTTGVAVISTTNLFATMHSNCISGNTTGMTNLGAGPVTAESNWWGHATGPYNAASNSSGQGNPVSGDVDFNPWLTGLAFISPLAFLHTSPILVEIKLGNSPPPGGAPGANVFLYLNGAPMGMEVTDAAGVVSIEGTGVPVGVYALKAEAAAGCLSADALVAIYDPGTASATGGGWLSSPSGAYVSNASVTGKAKFEFSSKYKKGAGVPTGETEFQFQLADLNFSGTSHDWLVVGGPGNSRAQFKGSGRINGTGNYGFTLSVIDGDLKIPREKDKFRLMIWDESSGAVVYDNQAGALGNAEPTTAIGGGSIVIHVPKKREVAEDHALEIAAEFMPTEFALFESYPNPFNPATNIRFDIPSPSVVTLKVYDVLGREVTALVDNAHREAGRYEVTFDASRLASGVYFYRLSAGSFQSLKKMVLLK